MLAAALALGLLIGLSLGALGGGGSILTVPALVYVLGQSPYEATTGSLVIVGVTALAGMVAHARQGRVRLRQGLVFGVLGVGGSYLGSRLSSEVDPEVLLLGFAGLMLVAAGAMLRRSFQQDVPAAAPERTPAVIGGPAAGVGVATATDRGERSEPGAGAAAAEPSSPAPAGRPSGRSSTPGRGRRRALQAVRVVVAASLVGLLTGFFGVGGGFVIVPALVLVLRFPMPVAVGTSLLVIAINGSAALATRLHVGVSLEWETIAALTVAAIVGSLLGSRVVGRVDPRVLTGAFAVLLVAVALYTAARSLSLLA